ncbi:hypothetical protein GGGNBK_10705 [Sporosarcina sp. ANT_H38]
MNSEFLKSNLLTKQNNIYLANNLKLRGNCDQKFRTTIINPILSNSLSLSLNYQNYLKS